MRDPVVVIAAGGTGGHLSPGIAVADAVMRARPGATVCFVGTGRGLEGRMIPAAGYRLRGIDAVPFAGGALRAAVVAPLGFLRASLQARRILRAEHASVVAGMGGYASVPVVVAARTLGVPALIHEQNAVPGLSNLLAARFTANVAVAFSEAAAAFRWSRPRVIGMPVPPSIVALDRMGRRAEAREFFDLRPDLPTLLVFGGSQGAARLNAAAVALASRWRDRSDRQILLAAGREKAGAALRDLDAIGGPLVVRCVPFVERMDLAYAAADVALTRAGAATIAELATTGLPAILVPYPYARRRHQAANARALARVGGAVVVDDAEATVERLEPLVERLLADPEKLAWMGSSGRRLGGAGAADRMAAWILECAEVRGG